MRRLLVILALTTTASAQQPLTLQQILSAPYALSLTAAPTGPHFAWVENAEGRRNIWIGAKGEPAKQITHYTEDDGEDIASLTWSPDATSIAYTRGTENGASGHPANPAHLQHSTAYEIFIQPIDAAPQTTPLVEGHSPLFTADGKSIIFIRAGQIWTTRIPPAKPVAKPSATPSDQQSLLDSVLSLVGSLPIPDTSKQLIVDRGSASSLTLSPDGKLLAYVSRRNINDQAQTLIGLYNFDTKALRFLSTSSANDSAPVFSPDSKQIAWLRAPSTKIPEFANPRTSPDPWSIQLADIATGTTHTIFTAEPNKPGSVLPHLSTGQPHLYWTAPPNPTTELSSRPDLAPNLSSRPKRSSVERSQHLPPSGRLIFFSEADGWVHLYSTNPSRSTPPQLLTPGDYEVEDATLNGTTLVYASNQATQNPADADLRHLWKLDLTASFATPEQISSGSIQTHPQITTDGTIAALVSTERRPMAVRIIRPGTPNLLHNFIAESNSYPAAQLVTPQQVLFKTTDGVELHSQLFLPKASTGKHPAILFVHGGPQRQMLLGYPSTDYYSNVYAMNQYLALRGYIVLSVNYRCGIGYGLNFRQCEHSGAAGAAEYADVLAAAAYLRSRDDVDTAHIGIWGGSYGGYLTALALARNSDIFAAGVDFHGVHEWSLEDNAKSDWLYGPGIARISALAHTSSPMADIEKWHSPVLLIAGDDDPEVAYAQTTTLATALRTHNVPVEELIFPDEVHDFLLHKDWLAAFQATADFFDRTLKPLPK